MEGLRQRQERAGRIAASLAAWFPEGTTSALAWRSPLELLVATILAAQARDEVINTITPVLFSRFPDARALAEAPVEELEGLIRLSGFFRNKAKSVQGCARALVERHGGEVPRTMEELVALPGVGRKTANVVLTNCFGVPGIVTDTHVLRVSARLHLTMEEDPEKVERDLMALLPPGDWAAFCHRMTWFGRRVCGARKPDCPRCPLRPDCPTGQGLAGAGRG